MHLLATKPGKLLDGEDAVDLGQSPGELVFLSAADSDLACLAQAVAERGAGDFRVRLANLLRLKHAYSVDLYVEKVVAHARFVCVRVIGGQSYWPYGLQEIAQICRDRKIPFAALLDDGGDEEGAVLSTVSPEARNRIAAYLRQGGIANARQLLGYASALAGKADARWAEPAPVLDAGLYWPGMVHASLEDIRRHWIPDAPVVALTFYRALVMSGGTVAIDAVVAALRQRRLNPLPLHVQSLKNAFAANLIRDTFEAAKPDVVLNATSFAVSAPGDDHRSGPLEVADAPILQIVLAAISHADWQASSIGLSARDLAMNVALPEVDGRILAGAIAFKEHAQFDSATEAPIVVHHPDAGRIAFVADLARGWASLRRVSVDERRVGLILANYPNRDGRLGNGVGLDTPASVAHIVRVLQEAGYDVGQAPAAARTLMDVLRSGPTNAQRGSGGAFLPLAAYRQFFQRLDASVQATINGRWSAPEADPFFDLSRGGFVLPLHRFGNLAIGVQPARGYNVDPKATYHDPDLPPPHGYVAFYAWLRTEFDAHAIVHVGKHGNLEWLPGKALALSDACFPAAVAGPVPQIYPFIVNDPGEGTQAKRRISAVILDHLTPPLTRAESYGPLKALEVLVDEYYLAAGLDPRRTAVLRDDILALAQSQGLDVDCGMDRNDSEQSLTALDNYLCELKELQIRDGLHVYGESPTGQLRIDLLVALARVPRRSGDGGDASLLRALAQDLKLGFDPLDCRMGDTWTGLKPEALAAVDHQPWRSTGDTVERLELFAQALVGRTKSCAPDWTRTGAVLATVHTRLNNAVESCGARELGGLLGALSGKFVAPGPSGAPTRGRTEVLPTGRNFYSVDTRAVPTPAAWTLGWKSAQLLVEDHLQRHGSYPGSIAITAWGTSNMRTGGDDIAQALALMGARPTWEGSTGRVTGFEIMPVAVLGRPRVDVTVRISGFFRDAFADQIDLLASAAAAVMQLDEADEENAAAARYRADVAALKAAGKTHDEALIRVFGSKPGAYGAGLQAMIDERLWTETKDLAEAYLVWGSYAYGAGRDGTSARDVLEKRLSSVEAIVQNQDNREHDLLDSDDYYQFEGGMFAAVQSLRGQAPAVYHNDHSRPERPLIRTLDDEIARVVRARLVNPKWIAGVMRHGYKGASEIAASIDYLFAFAATTGMVRHHHFDLAYDAFIADEKVYAFMASENPDALRETAARLSEAIERGLWCPKSNSAAFRLAQTMERETSA